MLLYASDLANFCHKLWQEVNDKMQEVLSSNRSGQTWYSSPFSTTILCIECENISRGPIPSLATKEGTPRAPAILNSSLSGMDTSGTSEVQSDSGSTRAPHLTGVLGS